MHLDPATLSPLDQALVEDLLEGSLDLPALAAKHAIPLSQVLARVVSPPIEAYLAALDRFTQIREQARQSRALTALVRALDACSDPNHQRLAAAAILRYSTAITRPPKGNSSGALPRPEPARSEPHDQTPPAAPTAPAPITTPHARRPESTPPRPVHHPRPKPIQVLVGAPDRACRAPPRAPPQKPVPMIRHGN